MPAPAPPSPSAPPPAPPPSPPGAPGPSGIKLLVVDDSVTMRKALEISLRSDFALVFATSADEALREAHAGGIAGVVLDTTLPGQDGYAVGERLRRELPHLALVLLTSKVAPYSAERGAKAGIDTHFDKPFDSARLLDEIWKPLQSRGYIRLQSAPAPLPPPPREPPPEVRIDVPTTGDLPEASQHAEVEARLRAELAPRIEAELRASIEREMRERIEAEVHARIEAVVREVVAGLAEHAVREELARLMLAGD